MKTSRRKFIGQTAGLATTSGLLAADLGQAQNGLAATEDPAGVVYKVFPVGRVELVDNKPRIRIFAPYADALLGLEGWSHLNVFYWFDQNDTPAKRRVLQVHPRGNPQNPLTGVFACRAPVRPNLIALTVCQILSVETPLVYLDKIDAFDGTPVLDLKPYIPPDGPRQGVRVPDWTGRGR